MCTPGSAFMLAQHRLWAVRCAAIYLDEAYTFAHAALLLLASPLLFARSSWVWEPSHQEISTPRSPQPQQQQQGAKHKR
jgi:hypothetical protein